MPGESFSVSFNGRRFALPADMEPTITIGGLTNKAMLRNGDGTVVPQKGRLPGSIKGLTPRLVLSNGDLEAMQNIAGQSSINCVYVGPEGNFEGTGFIDAKEEGIKMNQGTGVTEAFDFVCSNGQPLKRR